MPGLPGLVAIGSTHQILVWIALAFCFWLALVYLTRHLRVPSSGLVVATLSWIVAWLCLWVLPRVTSTLGLLAIVTWAAAPVSAGSSVRISGQTHSISPSDDVLVIAVPGTHGSEEMVWVDARHATVVSLRRGPDRAWEWRERPANLYRLPINTFVTVIGRRGIRGIIHASRIEVPELDSDESRYRPKP